MKIYYYFATLKLLVLMSSQIYESLEELLEIQYLIQYHM